MHLFVLDLFTPARLEVVMRRLDAVLERDGTWLCADFAPPEGPMLRRLAQRALLAGLYGAFGAACAVEARRLPPIGPAFERLGYRPERQAGGAAGLLHTAIWRRAGGTS